jgi:tRNA-intron endonuclease, archaea type
MDISGELVDTHIIIRKPGDVGRLYTKSHFGTPLSGNTLRLDLIEGVFLLDEGKMRLYHHKKPIDFSQLVLLASQHIPEFETKYLVFKDLRTHGHAISLCSDTTPVMFRQYKQKNTQIAEVVIAAFSERDNLDMSFTRQLLYHSLKKKEKLWFALVDEEGDLTYYELSLVNLKGDILEQKYINGSGIMLKNRVIVLDSPLADQLLKKEFFGKPFGCMLQLSFVEAVYLVERNILTLLDSSGKTISFDKSLKTMTQLQPDLQQRLLVFHDLKKRGLLVKTGFKFGAHFRAYTKQPEKTHAEYLIHVVEKGFTSIWSEVSRAVRLAHSVNKEFVFAVVDGSSIEYIRFGRLRP